MLMTLKGQTLIFGFMFGDLNRFLKTFTSL
jgi:hypothetical protein